MANIIPSPKGRFVQGDAFEPQTKDQQGNPLTIKTGPNAGQPTQRYFMGVAYPKSDPTTLPYLMEIARAAAASWPAYFPQGASQQPPLFGSTHPRFSMKVMDGDGVDDNGKPNAQKDGFAGHWVVKYSSAFAPKVYEAGKYSEMERVDIDRAKHSLLKRGYFVRIGASFEGNGNDQRPGMYSNLQMVEIVHAGPEITSGPDGAAVFGGGAPAATTPLPTLPTPAPAAPAGLVPVPGAAHSIEALRAAGWTDDQIVAGGYATRPLPVSPPVAPPVPSPAASTPPVPAPAPVTPSPSSPPPAPYSGYMHPPAPARVMLPAAQGQTYEAMIAAGWTDALLVQHGMMQA